MKRFLLALCGGFFLCWAGACSTSNQKTDAGSSDSVPPKSCVANQECDNNNMVCVLFSTGGQCKPCRTLLDCDKSAQRCIQNEHWSRVQWFALGAALGGRMWFGHQAVPAAVQPGTGHSGMGTCYG